MTISSIPETKTRNSIISRCPCSFAKCREQSCLRHLWHWAQLSKQREEIRWRRGVHGVCQVVTFVTIIDEFNSRHRTRKFDHVAVSINGRQIHGETDNKLDDVVVSMPFCQKLIFITITVGDVEFNSRHRNKNSTTSWCIYDCRLQGSLTFAINGVEFNFQTQTRNSRMSRCP